MDDPNMDFPLFLSAEVNAIEKSKYIESEKVRRDLFFDELGFPSQNFYVWWTEHHAEEFRKAWPASLCRTCQKIMTCNDCLQEKCANYKPLEEKDKLS
jgi:hypothetical protein